MTPLALGGIATVDVPVSLLPVAGARVDAFALAANREDSASLVSVDGWGRRFPFWLVAALGALPQCYFRQARKSRLHPVRNLIYLKTLPDGCVCGAGRRIFLTVKEERHAQIDDRDWLRSIGCNIRARNDACAASSTGRHGDASCCRLWSGQDTGQRRMRGADHGSPDPPGRPQVRAISGRRLRCIRVNVSGLAPGPSRSDATPMDGSDQRLDWPRSPVFARTAAGLAA
jgi:hypothetical protein